MQTPTTGEHMSHGQLPAEAYPAHPAAELFPLMEGQELAALVDDIKEHGLLDPIVLYEGKVLDGRNRLRACQRAGVEPRFVEWAGDGGSPTAFVLSHNLHRRHLTASQRAFIANDARPMFEAEAQANRGARTDLPTKIQGGSALPLSRETALRAADLVDVSPTYVYKAAELQRQAPDVAEKVKAGEMSISTAMRQVRREQGNGERPTSAEAPFIPNTARKLDIANAQKRRLTDSLSTMQGICTGMLELKLPVALSVMTIEEVTHWSKLAGTIGTQLHRLRRELEEAME